MIKIQTVERGQVLEHFINTKYIVAIDELPGGGSQIFTGNGGIYTISDSVYEIKQMMDADKEGEQEC